MTMFSVDTEESLRQVVNGLLFVRVDSALLRDMLVELDALRALKLAAERVRDDCYEVLAPDGEFASEEQQDVAWKGLVAALRSPVETQLVQNVTVDVIVTRMGPSTRPEMTKEQVMILNSILGCMTPEERIVIEDVRSLKLEGSLWFEWYNTHIPGKLDKWGGPAANGDILEEITERVVTEAKYQGSVNDVQEAMDIIGNYISVSWVS